VSGRNYAKKEGAAVFGQAGQLATEGLRTYKEQRHLDDWEPSNDLKSLLGLVVSYLLMGSQPLDAYPKSIASLLSHNPLHVLFALLPQEEQGMFSPELQPDALLQLVEEALPKGMDLDSPVFEGGIYQGSTYEAKREKYAGCRDITRMLDALTRRRWIQSIPTEDLLTQEVFARVFDG
jgi:hypothetical protein